MYQDLREIKKLMQIDPLDTSEDFTLNLYNEWATSIIEEVCGRDFTFKGRTQFYKGTGTQKLLLRNRPVFPAPPSPYPAIQVWYDPNGFFGQPTDAFGSSPTTQALTYAGNTTGANADYTLQIDQDDGSSRSGILVKINSYWTKPVVRQTGMLSPFVGDDTGSIKCTYTAGWTADTIPGAFRAAAAMLVTRLAYIFPLGVELNSESYEERSVGVVTSERDKLLALVRPLVLPYKNWKW